MTYPQVKEYLNSFVNYERQSGYLYKKSFKLKRFKKFLQFIGQPQLNLRVIHVAGSKGKGSVCVFIANILRQAGFKVGLYTSPHLIDFRERIRILEKKSEIKNQKFQFKRKELEGIISKRDICLLVSNLRPFIDKFNKNSELDALTFFEVYTALAFQYFKNKKVDFVILETGLGGRLDATNVCSSLLAVITPISLEHSYLLGKTLKQIASEKAAIIKKENKKATNEFILALSSKQDRSVLGVIRHRARGKKALLFYEDKDFKFLPVKKMSFNYVGLRYALRNLNINLLGKHQMANASLAIASIEALRYHNIYIGKQAIRQGLRFCRWPARCEVIQRSPLVVLDGAQNAASLKALKETLGEFFPGRKIWAIFGIAKDKELKDSCSQIEEITKNIILTKTINLRSAEPKELLRYFKTKSIYTTNCLKEALRLVKDLCSVNNLILITGSLYLCGEAREMRFRQRREFLEIQGG